jgi:tRNA dimethylallyltransferase
VTTADDPQPPVVAVVGATATGKSDLAVELALLLDGEVVNADSMQLYRGMDVGTAKLPEAERRGVPHHLLDVWDVRVAANVAEYQSLVRPQLLEIAARGRRAVLVGGSGLYVRAALDDLAFPGTDEAVRSRLEAELVEAGPAVLHARLAAVDPPAAAAILPTNGRRVVRALEVVEITGRPFTASLPEPGTYAVPAVQVGLAVDRSTLDARIESRVDRMWQQGLVDEVRGLAAAGLREGRTASRALGSAQVLRHLDGDCTEDQARAETVRATRRFARRQDSWFRRDRRVHWLAADDPDLVATVLAGLDGVWAN